MTDDPGWYRPYMVGPYHGAAFIILGAIAPTIAALLFAGHMAIRFGQWVAAWCGGIAQLLAFGGD